jgi:iron complex transport system ATP-binding protein
MLGKPVGRWPASVLPTWRNATCRHFPAASGSGLAIATLLTQAPQLYLLDEPLAHLDLNHQIATLELFATLNRGEQMASVMVLHEPGLAARFCSRALLLFDDGTTLLGRSDEVISSDSLSRLYGYPLREVGAGELRWFMPA